jgi:hypothetical protein
LITLNVITLHVITIWLAGVAPAFAQLQGARIVGTIHDPQRPAFPARR